MLKASTTHQIEWTGILYEQALLNEGSPISDPQRYSQRIARLMMDAAGAQT
jgi:HSP90 family molecular chaperone